MDAVERPIGMFEDATTANVSDVSLPWRVAAELLILVALYYGLKIYMVWSTLGYVEGGHFVAALSGLHHFALGTLVLILLPIHALAWIGTRVYGAVRPSSQ